MAQTVTKAKPGRKAPTTHKRATTTAHSPAPTTIERTTKLSEEVLESVESGQRAAIEAVRKFTETVDRALPAHGEGPSRRQEVVDSAMEMADRLVHTQYEFIRKLIDSAGTTLGRSHSTK